MIVMVSHENACRRQIDAYVSTRKKLLNILIAILSRVESKKCLRKGDRSDALIIEETNELMFA